MSDALKELLRVAEKIEKRLKLGQSASSQAADVQDALAKHRLWDLSNDVAALLNAAHVPDSAAVQINMVVDKNLMPHFAVSTNPQHPSALALARLLQQKYGTAMQAALKAEKLNVSESLNVKWLTF